MDNDMTNAPRPLEDARKRGPCPSFPDPFHALPPERALRTALVTDNEISARLNAVHRNRSTLQITINILLKKL